MDRKRRNIITDDDIAASASATVRLFQKNLSRYRTHLKSDEELYKESIRLEKEAEERKRRKSESQKPIVQQSNKGADTNTQSKQPSQANKERPLSSYTEEELLGKDGQERLDKGIRLIAESDGDIEDTSPRQGGSAPKQPNPGTKKLSKNPTREELREYWDNSMRTSQRQMRPVSEQIARNAEAMRISQEAYKRSLEEKRANATVWDKTWAALDAGSAKYLANLVSTAASGPSVIAGISDYLSGNDQDAKSSDMLVDSVKSKDRGFWYNVVGEGNKYLAGLAANKKQAEEYSETIRDMYGISNFAYQTLNILSLTGFLCGMLPYAFIARGVVRYVRLFRKTSREKRL